MDIHPLAFAAFNIVFLFLVFRPLEICFPAKPSQKFFRPKLFLDFCFYWGQFLLWNGFIFWCLFAFKDSLDWLVPRSFRDGVAAQPWWLQAVEVVVLSDFCVYWGHRLQHNVGFLWRFHSVHHSSEHLDWLAASREHPLDTIYTVSIINFPMFALGFPVATITLLILFRGVWAVFIHSNVRIPLGPLGVLLGSPALHHWHHDRARDAGNYANLSPLMDLLFGTYHCPPYEPVCFGLKGQAPETYLGFMVRPLLPHRPEAEPKSEEDNGTTRQEPRYPEPPEVGSEVAFRVPVRQVGPDEEPTRAPPSSSIP